MPEPRGLTLNRQSHAGCWTAASLMVAVFLAAEARSDDRPAEVVGLADATPTSATQAIPTQQRIEQLVRQLGAPQFAVRRSAANELRRIGAEAFDALHAATEDADPEIASTAHYLLRQITVRWVQNDDPAAVRAILRQYDGQSSEARLRAVEELAKLPLGEGVSALCRIARYDRSPLVSRMAAIAIIRPSVEGGVRSSSEQDEIEQALGGSMRVAVVWLRQYLAQWREPAGSIAAWQQLIDEETARIAKNSRDTSAAVVAGLLWNLADVHRQLGDAKSLSSTLDRMVELDALTLDQTAVELLEWLTRNKAWPVLDEFLSKHQPRFEQSKRPLYYAAIARARQGKHELAEELATRAAQLEPEAALAIAKELEEHSQFEWSVREYRRAIEKPSQEYETIVARMSLANLLHDYEQHQQAAEVLQPLVVELRGDGRLARMYAELQQYYERRVGRSGLPEVNTLACRLHYYRACQYRAEGDWQRTRDELKLAIEFDPTDADVLIAMYRVPEADAGWREMTRRRIRELAQRFEQDIAAAPHEATNYNQWAWLISNTEGDVQKAIRYSHRSLELNTKGDGAAASYLDTLARCYYAAGDYENAIKYQRQALEKIDYMQVMHRQLAEFEKALAEKHSRN